MSNYERIEKAAVANMSSLKDLAEALFVDIPEGSTGGEPIVEAGLIVARNRIIAVGGEDRAVARLRMMRQTASWVISCVNTSNGTWVEGASYTLHEEAYKAGWTVEKLRSEYSTGMTVAKLREMNGKQGHGYTSKRTDDELFIDACAVIINQEKSGRELSGDASMARHFLIQVMQQTVDPSVIDELTDDIYAFLSAQA